MAVDTKIIIVEGNDFRVPIAMELEAIRAYLSSTYPSVASASITKGKRTIDGEDYETIEFVKKVGTKACDLATLLADMPPAWHHFTTELPPNFAKLINGMLTVGEVFDQGFDTHFNRVIEKKDNLEGFALCMKLIELPALPVSDDDLALTLPLGW